MAHTNDVLTSDPHAPCRASAVVAVAVTVALPCRAPRRAAGVQYPVDCRGALRRWRACRPAAVRASRWGLRLRGSHAVGRRALRVRGWRGVRMAGWRGAGWVRATLCRRRAGGWRQGAYALRARRCADVGEHPRRRAAQRPWPRPARPARQTGQERDAPLGTEAAAELHRRAGAPASPGAAETWERQARRAWVRAVVMRAELDAQMPLWAGRVMHHGVRRWRGLPVPGAPQCLSEVGIGVGCGRRGREFCATLPRARACVFLVSAHPAILIYTNDICMTLPPPATNSDTHRHTRRDALRTRGTAHPWRTVRPAPRSRREGLRMTRRCRPARIVESALCVFRILCAQTWRLPCCRAEHCPSRRRDAARRPIHLQRSSATLVASAFSPGQTRKSIHML